MKQRIDKWKQMVASNDPMADHYLKGITVEAKSEGKIDEMNEAIAYYIEIQISLWRHPPNSSSSVSSVASGHTIVSSVYIELQAA